MHRWTPLLEQNGASGRPGKGRRRVSPLANAARGLSLIVMLTFVAALAACSPVSIAAESYRGFPGGVDEPVLESPLAFWDAPRTLLLTLGGSSSCPTVPTSVEQTDGEVVIVIDRGWAFACTADFALVTYVLAVDEEPTTVTLDSDGERHPVEVRDL